MPRITKQELENAKELFYHISARSYIAIDPFSDEDKYMKIFSNVRKTKSLVAVKKAIQILIDKAVVLTYKDRELYNEKTNTKRTERLFTSIMNEPILTTNNKKDLENIYNPVLKGMLREYLHKSNNEDTFLIRILGPTGWFTFNKSYLTKQNIYDRIINGEVNEYVAIRMYALSISKIQ